MTQLYAELLVENNLLELLSQRGRNRVVKEALRHGLKYWHEEILPKHFSSGNYLRYPGAITMKKKDYASNDTALVWTGKFRDRILGQQKIRATAKSASIRYALGTPVPYNSGNKKFSSLDEYNKSIKAMDIKTKKIIFASMKGKSIKFEDARKRMIAKFYKRSGYPNYLKKRMKSGIRAINDEDRQDVFRVMKKFVIENYKTMGKANYKKVSK